MTPLLDSHRTRPPRQDSEAPRRFAGFPSTNTQRTVLLAVAAVVLVPAVMVPQLAALSAPIALGILAWLVL